MNTQTIPFDKRAFLLRIYALTLGVVILYLTLYLFFPVPAYRAYMLVGLAAVLILGFFLTLKTAYTRFSSHYYIISCYILLCLNTATSGGVEAPGAIWFLLCPLIGILTLSARVAVFWLIMVLITLSSFYFLRDYLVVEQFRGGTHWYL